MFDLVSSEYGWSDEQILDLTVSRLRQIKEAIDFRRALRRDVELQRIEWQTQALALQLAGLAQGGKKHAQSMIDNAHNMRIRPRVERKAEGLPPGLDFDPENPHIDPNKIRDIRVAAPFLRRLERPKLT